MDDLCKLKTLAPSSLALSLASLPPLQRQAILTSLSSDDTEKLRYAWEFWRRPEQTAPTGDWDVWLYLAGRGSGKTRTASEWVRDNVESGKASRIGLVARTAADVRDTMVQGESGLLTIAPPWFRPDWEPSKRRLTWPNGAMALTFSAEEPDQLRGPQFDLWWGDETACLAGDTQIETHRGPVPIKDVVCGDHVLTRNGYSRVWRSWESHPKAAVQELHLSNGRKIVATPEHRFWVGDRGFVPLRLLHRGDILLSWDKNRWSYGADKSGLQSLAITKTGLANCYIEQSTRMRLVRFLRLFTSITRMAMDSITDLRILRLCPPGGIYRDMGLVVTAHGRPRNIGSDLSLRGEKENQERSSARNAARYFLPRACVQRFVLSAVEHLRDGEILGNVHRYHVLSATKCSWCIALACVRVVRTALGFFGASPRKWPISGKSDSAVSAIPFSEHQTTERLLVPGNAGSYSEVAIVSIQPLTPRRAVYDLSVECAHEFFANGVLVHNSWKYDQATWDMLQFGARLGDRPRGIVTTTPRPTKLMRSILADSGTRVTRGSTYDNRGNLAPAFLRRMLDKYGGTTLGRQELDAEMLDGVAGSLWQRKLFDDNRVSTAPTLTRIVVAVDPATTKKKTSADTGIVVAGLGEDGHGYVLDDLTCHVSPNEWATESVKAYRAHKADRVVGEVNNGGDLVETVIRNVDASVSYKAVHASKGKYARAEPVAALYEQGRIHHVGMFAELEDQCCTWLPTDEESPDRMDALVWALTELMVGGGSGFFLV